MSFYIDILDIDAYIEKFKLEEVTTSSMYSASSSEPHPDGILSYRIFGQPGTDQRRYVYGYINLNSKFIHPKVYASLISLKRDLYRDLINGVGAFTVENGELKRVVSDNNDFVMKKGEKVGTGIDFLYEIWDQLDFKPNPTQAQQTKETRTFLNLLKKKDVFVTKWLLIPAFYRDVDLSLSKRNEYNTFYIRLIELSSMVKANSLMFAMFSTSDAHKKIQATLNEIYNLFVIEKLGGTKGFVQQNVIGKTTDFAARLVASAPDYNVQNSSDAEVDFTHVAVPLYVALKTFLPFIAHEIRQFFRNYIGANKFIYVYDKTTKKRERYEIDPNYLEMLSIKNLQKRIDIYSNSRIHRIMPVTIKVLERKEELPLMFFDGEGLVNSDIKSQMETDFELLPEKDSKKIKHLRPLNWTELFYIIAYKALKDKMTYITRFPIESHNSIYPAFMNIVPSRKFKKKFLFGEEYPRFPDFSEIEIYGKPEDVPILKLNSLFPDTLRVHPAYMAQMGLDFDGRLGHGK